MGHFNIAVDGPAGAGKSTIARMVAEKLGFVYVDTGAMYRTMALHFIRLGISPGDEEAIARACRDVDVTICYKDGAQQVMLNGENVTGLIRTEEVGGMASATSVYAPVRKKLVELQQGYRYLRASGCTCQDLSDRLGGGTGRPPVQGTDGKGRGVHPEGD